MKLDRKKLLGAALGIGILCGSLGAAAKATHDSPWGEPTNLQAVAGTDPDVNTEFNEGCPMQSPDGLSLYMASNRPGGLGGQDIWVARRTSKHAPFGAPVNLDAPVNSAADDFCPTPLRGRRLLFVSARAGGCGGPDIYLTRRDDAQGWEAPANLGCQVNSAFGEAGPSLVRDADGRRALYFSSNRPGGFSSDGGSPPFDSDIYVSVRLQDGSFGAAQLVDGLNTAADDSRPNVRRDGLELVFDSNRPNGPPTAATNDIYSTSRATRDDPWPAPILLDVVSSTANDTRASLSRDGKTLYFGSNRVGTEGQSDIYVTTRSRVGHGFWRTANRMGIEPSGSPQASLTEYLSSMSRLLPISALRARAVGAAIHGVFTAGDPPYMRQVTRGCSKIRALDLTAELRDVTAPQRLRARHRALLRAYSGYRKGAKPTGRSVQRANVALIQWMTTHSAKDELAWHRADHSMREELRQFLPELRGFRQAVRAWRSAELEYSRTLGTLPPEWVKQLR